ncbi:MAG: hypothetical protein IH598_15655 [Bacteroidales bacterium]|nr:hypothetical protein [Bacteroidales bacterium]
MRAPGILTQTTRLPEKKNEDFCRILLTEIVSARKHPEFDFQRFNYTTLPTAAKDSPKEFFEPLEDPFGKKE